MPLVSLLYLEPGNTSLPDHLLNHPKPNWGHLTMRTILQLFIALCALGILVSFGLHLGILFGLHFPIITYLGMFGSVFVLVILDNIVSIPYLSIVGRKNFWKTYMPSAPKWLQLMVYGFTYYVVFWVVILFLVMLTSKTAKQDSAPPAAFFVMTAFFMGMYTGMLAQFYAILQQQRKTARKRLVHHHPGE